jgi:sulfur-oxidizing protein SoxY
MNLASSHDTVETGPGKTPARIGRRSVSGPEWTAAALVAGLLWALSGTPWAAAQAQEQEQSQEQSQEQEQRWNAIRSALFADRPIQDGKGVVELEAPYRAEDAAVVPITARALIPQERQRYIKNLHLLIDNNPSPVAAVVHFPPGSASATIDTRVRVNEYTHIRAVAETNDGALYMSSRYVKAAGGCSAPALKDQQAALARLGKTKLKLAEPVRLDQPVTAQLMISHPNNSGMQFDQMSRTYIPAHFVRKISVRYNDEPVLDLEGDISLSENPTLRFTFVPKKQGELVAVVEDSQGMSFQGRWPIAEGTR